MMASVVGQPVNDIHHLKCPFWSQIDIPKVCPSKELT